MPRALDSFDAMVSALEGCDSLIHLRYEPPVSTEPARALVEEISANLVTTAELLAAADRAGVEWCAFASSVSLYDPSAREASESDPPRRDPAPYARVKAWSEDLFRGWERLRRTACSLRLSTVYGPGETGHRAIPAMIEAALAGRPLRVDAEGSASFDPVFVLDVARAFTLAAEQRATGTFNIAGGHPVEVQTVARTIVALTGSTSTVDIVQSATGGQRPTCDIKRACENLGFTPSVPLEAGLTLEIDWQRARARVEA